MARHGEAVKRLAEASIEAKQAAQQLSEAGGDQKQLANIETARSLQGLIDKAAREQRSLGELGQQQSVQQQEERSIAAIAEAIR